MTFEQYQRAMFEWLTALMFGPEWAAIGAGYAVVLEGVFYLTPSGEKYVASVS